MNPLVEKMLDKTVSNDTETRLLEDLFERDVKCQSTHKHPENRYCSSQVAFVGYSCTPPLMVCEAAGEAWQRWIDECDSICNDCGIPLEKCWTIRPI